MSRSGMSSTMPRRDGSDFRNQICATGRSQFDVRHALTTNLRLRNLNTTLFANNTAMLQTLVLATQALIVLDRAKDFGAEQSVAFGLERSVVDRFRLL